MRINLALRPPRRSVVRDAQATTPVWPSYTGTSQLVGTSSSGVTVYVDPSLGASALQNANDLLSAAGQVVSQNNAIFGITGGAVDVIILALNGATDGTGGADHDGCDFATGSAIEVDVSYGSPKREVGLFEAELGECAMNGRLCGLSTREALSRWCAMVVSSECASGFRDSADLGTGMECPTGSIPPHRPTRTLTARAAAWPFCPGHQPGPQPQPDRAHHGRARRQCNPRTALRGVDG